ncbi:MAG TPA: cation-translocating P-type ATPase [Xanthobacteraceae bacterium]|nr:cation-translocating P-type ATPase [Xanthobacteraceae bacterium]
MAGKIERRMDGLTSTEAAARLAAEGTNELAHEGRRRVWQIAFEVLREPMLLMLLAAGAIYLTLGDLGEALLIAVLASASVVVTIVQEARSERVLDALRDLTSPRALVVRDGQQKRIPGREVVRGDLVVLNEGDRVPADATLVSSLNLEVDESLLTGEAVPVRKTSSGELPVDARPGGDDLPFVYSGSLIARGQGLAEVTATGARSEIGKIGKSLSSIESEPPPIQSETRRLVRLFAVAGVSISVLFTALYGWLQSAWINAFLGGIALSMALLPEEFPVILTVFVVMGAWRISRAGVLTRRSAAIETLGAATVLCTDKTGTITENRMSIAEVRTSDAILGVPNALRSGMTSNDVVAFGRLASQVKPFDPMELAFHQRAEELALESSSPGPERLVQQYPVSPDVLAMTNVWRQLDGSMLIAAKGAPETIVGFCQLSPDSQGMVLRSAEQMAHQGMRVLGVAKAVLAGEPPRSQHDIPFEFLGLVGLADPVRPSVTSAVRECRSAGIRVIMITGDYPATAQTIARKAGLDTGDVASGAEVAGLDDAALASRVRTTTVFARIQPEQKMRIVQALKANGEIVAMTGDGVNDAPSLKAAHIGIAMGGRGTDVAREASSIVLIRDDFSSIVHTIRLGRRIYDNIRKAMGFVMAAHIPIAGLALLPLAFGAPLILLPVHIAFLEMVVDPVSSIAFEAEPEEGDIMSRPPRNPKSPLFSTPLILWSLLQGGIILAATAAVFLIAWHRGMPEAEVRSLAFLTLVVGNIALILTGRAFSTSIVRAFSRPNPVLWAVLSIDAALLAIILSWPPVRSLFRFGPLHPDDLALCLGVGLAVLFALEFLKRPFRRALRM